MKTVIQYFIIVTFIIGVSACDTILGVRDVEPPEISNQSHWIPATTPELLVQNLINSFEYREYESYLKTLSDTSLNQGSSYIFQANANALTTFSGIFESWTISDEQIYFQGLLSACPSDSLLTLNLTEEEPYTQIGDSLTYQLNYTIEVHHTLENIPNTFSGKSIFHLSQNTGNYWVIHYWEDIYTGTDSWSDLKALF